MLGREVVEGQQFVSILDQAFGSLRVFRLESLNEQIEGSMGVVAGFGLPYIVQHFPGLGLGPLRKIIEHIAGLMHPAALLARGRIDFFQRRPEPHGTIARGESRGTEPTRLEPEKHLAPALRTFAEAVFDGEKMLLSASVDTDDDQHTQPVIGAAQPAVDRCRRPRYRLIRRDSDQSCASRRIPLPIGLSDVKLS